MSSGPYQSFGKYVLVERIAQGGMAEVFRARHAGVAGFQKTVAVKLILEEYAEDPKFLEMFTSEANLSVLLSHANVVQVYELGKTGKGTYFIAMEFVEGKDLNSLIKRAAKLDGTGLPPEVAAFIAQKMCAALNHAHTAVKEGQAQEIVHRDISPGNVLLSWTGEVKVTDFGIAKLSGSKEERTEVGTIKGKLSYMSPEQSRGEKLNGRSDVFAVGVTLFQMLTGEKPFKGKVLTRDDQRDDGGAELLRQIRGEPAPAPSSIRPGIPEALDAIVAKALAKDPEQRFDAAQMGRALGTWLQAKGAASGHLVDEQTVADLVGRLCGPRPVVPDVQVLPQSSMRTPVDSPALREEDKTKQVVIFASSNTDRTVVNLPPTVPEVTAPSGRMSVTGPTQLNPGRLGPLYLLGAIGGGAGAVALGLWLAKGTGTPAATPFPSPTAVVMVSPVPASSPAAGVATAAATPTAAPLPTSGQVVLSGTPSGALVTIDRTRTARLGEPIGGLSFGRHAVVVSAEDYRPKVFNVELSAAAPAATPAVYLVRGEGELRVGHGPANNYKVEIPGIVKPGQELERRFENIPAGRYRATITRDSQQWKIPVVIRDGKITKIVPPEDPAGMALIKEFVPES